MVAYNKFNVFTKDELNGKHNFSSDTFKVMLTDTAPVATNAVKSDITDISAATGYAAGGPALTGIAVTQVSGSQWKVTAAATTITAGATIGPFRYCVIYNDTQASPVKPLVCWADYGSEVTLTSPQTFTITPDQTNGLFSES